MNIRLRLIFAVIMPVALMFGFLHLFLPGSDLNFERLHIFFFNLCSGGTIILIYTEGFKRMTWRTGAFFLLSFLFAILAFMKIYAVAIAVAVLLAIIVESIRVKMFSLFPLAFFSNKEPIFKKFHQASLLCLSIGLLFSAFVMLNNKFLELVDLPKLGLNTFFLGFSFPVSLITMSVIFSMIDETKGKSVRLLKEVGFWTVNLGVIIFFVFIIASQLHIQVVVTLALFSAVIMILFLYYRFSKQMQQKNFLISGLLFLLFSAITGIAYILLEIVDGVDYSILERILRLHAFLSLYGWNLCGLGVICRIEDFPIRLHSRQIISLHWFSVLIAGTVADYHPLLAVVSIVSYTIVLYMMFFSQGVERFERLASKS